MRVPVVVLSWPALHNSCILVDYTGNAGNLLRGVVNLAQNELAAGDLKEQIRPVNVSGQQL